MTRWTMAIDISRCTACYCCVIACKDEYWENDYLPHSAGQPKLGQFWVNVVKKERGKGPNLKVAYIPILCMQCDQAPCMKIAEENAVYKRSDGIVIIDPEKAVGQRQIVDACPYHVIFWNEEKNLPQKCTFCGHRLEEGKLPRCVQACPSNAFSFGDLDDPDSDVSKLLEKGQAEVFLPEYGTKPNVHYIDLHKITKCFIAGSVVFKDTDECAENVKATLVNQQTNETTIAFTNNFGDFNFDELTANGEYLIRLEHPGYTSKSIDVPLEEAVHLGYLFLEKTKS